MTRKPTELKDQMFWFSGVEKERRSHSHLPQKSHWQKKKKKDSKYRNLKHFRCFLLKQSRKRLVMSLGANAPF